MVHFTGEKNKAEMTGILIPGSTCCARMLNCRSDLAIFGRTFSTAFDITYATHRSVWCTVVSCAVWCAIVPLSLSHSRAHDSNLHFHFVVLRSRSLRDEARARQCCRLRTCSRPDCPALSVEPKLGTGVACHRGFASWCVGIYTIDH
jgi:hypothetical protein